MILETISRKVFVQKSSLALLSLALPVSLLSKSFMEKQSSYDVLIIGGSYAGLSAAMALGRSRRKVLVLDSGKPCNRQTPHAHNLITHDGDRPADIAQSARKQVAAYPTVGFISGNATHFWGNNGAFKVTTEFGDTYEARKILLATGVRDIPQPIPGFAECWGISVLHCPYCHGYEVADAPLGVIANGEMALEFATLIHHWSPNLTLFTNGPATFSATDRQQLKAQGIGIVEKEIAALEHEKGYLRQLTFADGSGQAVKAVFARGGVSQPDFVLASGVALGEEGMNKDLIVVDGFGKTPQPGVYAAGDCATPMRSLAAAIAAGNMAGAMINRELIFEAV